MQKILFTACFIFLYISATAQRKIDVLHYKYDLEISDTVNIIKGKATIYFKALERLSSITLDFSENKQAKGMSVSGIHKGERDDNRLSFAHSEERLIINFYDTLKQNEERQITIFYWGIPSDGLIISKNKYGHRTFFADNWPNRGHNWLPCIDDPADKATVEFVVTAPQHYQVISNGMLIEETNLPENKKLTHWKEDVPIATKVMAIGAADFAVHLAGLVDDCIPVYSWVYPEDRDKGFYDYEQAADILPFFIKNVGPYGYKKLANVQSKTTFGGLENANTIFYSESSVTGTRKTESLLAHEIAHQWFGNMATEKSFAHLWLSEGFATYFTILYFENKYGKDTAISMLKEDRNQVIAFAKKSDKAVVDDDRDYMQLLNANSYQKGGWILHMLRIQLGDSLFHKSIRTYYAAYAGKNADTKDLQKIFEKVSGKDLSVFFQQWLYTPGIPKLDLSWSYLAKEKKMSITVKQLQEISFVFPLDLQFNNTSGNHSLKTINVSKKEETFFIPVTQKPAKLVLDPNTSLLFTGTAIEKK
ncbi:MAG TPA: M1 family aminopeptidase [Chitinophagaceae bacterium]|nr:M1 family aminopeptidase [Chitinophagaceae bacterium]